MKPRNTKQSPLTVGTRTGQDCETEVAGGVTVKSRIVPSRFTVQREGCSVRSWRTAA